MTPNRILLLFFLIVLLLSCKSEEKKRASEDTLSTNQHDTLLLFYREDQLGAAWLQADGKSHQITTFAWQNMAELGYYDTRFDEAVPKQFRGKDGYVFRKSPFNGRGLEQCFACRPDEIETYATLSFVLKTLGQNK